MVLTIRNPAGWSKAIQAHGTGAGSARYAAYNWPDYTEHDASKECVLIKQIKAVPNAACMPDFTATIARECIKACFRSGNQIPTNSTVALPTGVYEKWIVRPFTFIFQQAAESTITIPRIEAVFDFNDAPIIASPTIITLGVFTEVGVNFADDDVYFEIDYSWAKAGTNELGAYLGWEALGA